MTEQTKEEIITSEHAKAQRWILAFLVINIIAAIFISIGSLFQYLGIKSDMKHSIAAGLKNPVRIAEFTEQLAQTQLSATSSLLAIFTSIFLITILYLLSKRYPLVAIISLITLYSSNFVYRLFEESTPFTLHFIHVTVIIILVRSPLRGCIKAHKLAKGQAG